MKNKTSMRSIYWEDFVLSRLVPSGCHRSGDFVLWGKVLRAREKLRKKNSESQSSRNIGSADAMSGFND